MARKALAAVVAVLAIVGFVVPAQVVWICLLLLAVAILI